MKRNEQRVKTPTQGGFDRFVSSRFVRFVFDVFDALPPLSPSLLHAFPTLTLRSSSLPSLRSSPQQLEKATKMNESEYPQGIVECGSDALRFGLLAHCGQVCDWDCNQGVIIV